MSTESTGSSSPRGYERVEEDSDNESSKNESSNNTLIIALVTAVALGVLWKVAKNRARTPEPVPVLIEKKVDVQALNDASNSLIANHREFYKKLTNLPEDIRADFEKFINTPLNKLPENLKEALDQFKKSDQFPLIVKSCGGIADPDRVALGKLFFDSKIQSIEEAHKYNQGFCCMMNLKRVV